LLPGKRVLSVGLEALAVGNVDDVVVRYDQPPHEFTQIRYAVDAATPLNTEYLTTAAAPGGTSMLQKFHASWRLLGGGDDVDMRLVTNRAIHPDDRILTRLDGRTGLLVPALSQAAQGSRLGIARAAWADHVGTTDEDLIAMLASLHFRVGRSFEAEAEHAADLMVAGGMRSDHQAVRLGIDLMRQWVLAGNRELSVDELRWGIDKLGLHVAEPAATLLIQTLDHDPQPEDATEALDWVSLFEEANPMARRRAVATDAYANMGRELQEAANRLIRAGHTRIVVRGPMRLASWFAAGAALPEVRGVHLRCGHPAQPWSTDDGGGPSVALDVALASEFGRGPDLAVAISFAANLTPDVVQFISNSELPIGNAIRIGLADGAQISSGAHAMTIARAVKEAIRQQLRDTESDHVHVFLATPAGLSLLLGHLWNRMAPTTVWEDLGVAGYQRAFEILS
jgi:hypothetical protein